MKTGAKKSLTVLLLILLVLSSGIERARAYIPCQCNNPPEQCTCFIQLGDKGYAVELIIDVLREQGYLQKPKRNNEFTPAVRQAVIRFQTEHGLECTGWMDDDTLNVLLLGRPLDEPEDAADERWLDICYVPTDGGRKFHTSPECSDMYFPRLVSRINAMRLGMEHCRRNTCPHFSSYYIDDYSSLGLKPRILPEEYDQMIDESGTTRVADGALPDDAEAVYIGNKKTHVFHRGSCPSVTDMNEKNRVPFDSRDRAIEEGYKPCGRCEP